MKNRSVNLDTLTCNCQDIYCMYFTPVARDILQSHLDEFVLCASDVHFQRESSSISFAYLLSLVLDVYSNKCVCILYGHCTYIHIFLYFCLRMQSRATRRFTLSLIVFSHPAGAEGAVYPRRGSRWRCARVASALLGDGRARQGWGRDGMEGDRQVKFELRYALEFNEPI